MLREGRRRRVRVTTVDWTPARRRKIQSKHRVNHRVYDLTLFHLVKRLRTMAGSTETIIAIEALPAAGDAPAEASQQTGPSTTVGPLGLLPSSTRPPPSPTRLMRRRASGS
jgi:hypothetical protein